MSLTQVSNPYPIFTDLDGSPLDNGYLFIGSENDDPETNPIQVYWDNALTIAAVQPIRTIGGYPFRNGSPGQLFTNETFSITVRNKKNEFVSYSPIGDGFDPVSVVSLASIQIGEGAGLVGTAPAIGSPLVFGTVDSRVRYDIDLTGAPFNMRPGVDEDQSPKLTDAVDAWQAAGGERRRILLPSGKLKWSTSANLTGINSGLFSNLLSGDNRQLTIAGAGRDQTILVGGEPGYGFMEITDSNALVLSGFSIDAPNSGVSQCQYGILGGRTVGNASTGFIIMEQIGLRGRFTKWPIFMMSIENSQIIDPVIWSVLGNGIALAMNNTNHSMTPKYLALGSGLGGNGVNKIISPWMASLTLATADSRLLLAEFTQDLMVQNAYFISSHAKAHIRLAKRAQMHIDGSQFEYDPFGALAPGALNPISIEFASGTGVFDPTYDIPEYRGTEITNSRLRSIYGDDGSKIVGLVVDGSNVLKSFHNGYAMNFDTLQDSSITVSKKLQDASAVPSRVDTKIRLLNGGNTFGPGVPREEVVAPFPSLDAFIDVQTGNIDGTTGLSTIPGAAVASSGMTANIAAPGSESVAIYCDWTVPDLVNLNECCIVGIGTGSTSLGTIGSISMALYAGQLILRSFGSSPGDINYYGTVDAGFVAKFKGKRIQMLLVRAKNAVAPTLYIDGSKVELGQTNISGTANWSVPVTGTWLFVGHQSTTPANNCPAIYHNIGVFNFAPTYEEASFITRYGLPSTLRWGGAYGASPAGCVGWWDTSTGASTRILDASNLGQHGTLFGTYARLQNQLNAIYRTNAGSPIGAVFPNYVGEEILDTVGNAWFKAYGLTNTSWQAL
jgi:hypothetical protein